jgi:hypothetical protein
MPTHRISDQFEPAAVLSDEQFEKLTAMLEAHHETIQGLLKPVHELAKKLTADGDKAST